MVKHRKSLFWDWEQDSKPANTTSFPILIWSPSHIAELEGKVNKLGIKEQNSIFASDVIGCFDNPNEYRNKLLWVGNFMIGKLLNLNIILGEKSAYFLYIGNKENEILKRCYL